MTIDSRYQIQVKVTNEDQTRYYFEYESAGEDTVEVYLMDDQGNRTKLEVAE